MQRDLLSKEGDNSRGLPITQSAGRRTSSPMMHHSGDVLEEPFVGTVPDPVDVVVARGREVRPALGDDGARTGLMDGLEDGMCHLVWVI